MHHREDFLRLIVAARETSPWRSMETAPKDGTRILLASTDGSIEVGYWAPEGDSCQAGSATIELFLILHISTIITLNRQYIHLLLAREIQIWDNLISMQNLSDHNRRILTAWPPIAAG